MIRLTAAGGRVRAPRKAAHRTALTTLLELCNPLQSSIALPADDKGWTGVTALAAAHGLLSLCYYRAVELGVPLPESVRTGLQGAHLRDRLIESAAVRQLQELRSLLAAEGIPMLALKGASAAVRLYPSQGLRTMSDLDVLIPADSVRRVTLIMREAGYRPAAAWTSEEERLVLGDGHPLCMTRRGSLLLEGHTDLLFGRGDSKLAAAEAFAEADLDSGAELLHLSREHFVIHSLLHWQKHVRAHGFAQLKGLLDVLYAMSRWQVDWQEIRSAAKRWGVESEVLTGARAVSDLWAPGLPLPRDPGRSVAFDLLPSSVTSRNPAHYAGLIRQARALPAARQRFRYLLRLCFPVAGHMRFRYGLPPGRSVWPYHLRRVVGRTAGLVAWAIRQHFRASPHE